jgi:hypothetical protein
LGTLPKKLVRHTRNAYKYRRGLEEAVIEVKGEVSLTDAHLIAEAVAAELHAAICRWLLRDRLSKMSTADVTTCSREILKANTARNKAFKQLGLERKLEDDLDLLYCENTADKPATRGYTTRDKGNKGKAPAPGNGPVQNGTDDTFTDWTDQ